MAATTVYADDIDPDNIGGFDRVLPGSYMLKVTLVDEESHQKGAMIVDGEVISGTTPQQEGKNQRIIFTKDNSKMAGRKLLALAIACGLTSVEAIKKARASNEPLSFDFQECFGKLICVNLEAHEYNNNEITQLRWDEIYHPTDKRANHIPLHAGMLKAAGITLPPNRPLGGVQVAVARPASAPAAKPAATAAAAASADDLLAGVV